MNNNIKVSVCMSAYNHESYIGMAIESVLRQETDFEIELIISDDSSTDMTVDVINKIIKNHSRGDIIRLYVQECNMGYVPNLIFLMKNSEGNYIANLDSDDYWEDSLKLQKQVDFMDANQEYSICFHNASVIDGKNNILSESLLKMIPEIGYSPEEMVTGSVMPTSTILFRNYSNKLPNLFKEVFNGDTFFFAFLAQFGSAKYMDNINNSCRRMHETGIWSSLNEYDKLKKGEHTFSAILKIVEKKYKPLVAKVVYDKLKLLLISHLSNRKYIAYIKDYFRITVIKMRYKL